MDPLERADFIRDQLKDSFACPTCGSADPAIIRGDACSDCTCWLKGHIDNCPGSPHRREGHEIREGWIEYEPAEGFRYLVEVK